MKKRFGFLAIVAFIMVSGVTLPTLAQNQDNRPGCQPESKEQRERREKQEREYREFQEKQERRERERQQQEKEKRERAKGIYRA